MQSVSIRVETVNNLLAAAKSETQAPAVTQTFYYTGAPDFSSSQQTMQSVSTDIKTIKSCLKKKSASTQSIATNFFE